MLTVPLATWSQSPRAAAADLSGGFIFPNGPSRSMSSSLSSR